MFECEYFTDAQRAIKQAYQKGAEFSYNKCAEQLIKAKEIMRDAKNSAKREY